MGAGAGLGSEKLVVQKGPVLVLQDLALLEIARLRNSPSAQCCIASRGTRGIRQVWASGRWLAPTIESPDSRLTGIVWIAHASIRGGGPAAKRAPG